MAWNEKGKIEKINDLLWFCKDWKSRKDIAEEFGLTPVESYHCIKYLKKLDHDVDTEKGKGKTGRAYYFKTRILTLRTIRDNYQ